MKQLKEAKQLGNNIEAAKAIRIVVNLFDTGGTSTNVYGKYYFNEYPELNNKTIVGIKLNTGKIDEGIGSYPDFVNFQSSINNNIGKNAIYVDSDQAKKLMLNLFNNKNELIIQNMPLNSLNTNIEQSSFTLNGKIIPFDTKLNLKASYIFSTYLFTSTFPKSVSLTFYYLDK
jgi:hypothetical protein